jgi:hypothetical protein
MSKSSSESKSSNHKSHKSQKKMKKMERKIQKINRAHQALGLLREQSEVLLETLYRLKESSKLLSKKQRYLVYSVLVHLGALTTREEGGRDTILKMDKRLENARKKLTTSGQEHEPTVVVRQVTQ